MTAPKFKTLAIMLAAGVAIGAASASPGRAQVALPDLVTLAPTVFTYRLPGEFLKVGMPVDAPVVTTEFTRPTLIMTHQVSVAEYAACVAAGACAPAENGRFTAPDMPVTGVNFTDAEAYAAWLSAGTGVRFRLPSDAEWALAAGSRFVDDAVGVTADPSNPAIRWLKRYEQMVAARGEAVPGVKPRGFFGANEHGVVDMAGNVWEWTSTCYARNRADADGAAGAATENCGVRVAEGRHRAYVSFFIRDAKGGGCAAGTPPDFLGFRLVRDNPAPFSFRSIGNFIDRFIGS
jgi:formylglycine-generating enzyme required for sulfatase activity